MRGNITKDKRKANVKVVSDSRPPSNDEHED